MITPQVWLLMMSGSQTACCHPVMVDSGAKESDNKKSLPW